MRLTPLASLLHHKQSISFTSTLLSTLRNCTDASTCCHKLHTNTTNTTTQSSLLYLQSLSTLINTLSHNPRNYTALTKLDTMLSQTHFLTSSVSLIAIDYLTQINKLQRAKSLLLHLKSTGKVSNFFLYSLVFDILVKDCVDINKVDVFWHEIFRPKLEIDASDYVIYVCKFGGVDEVKNVCERVLKGGKALRKQSYVALIGALCRINEGLLAKEVVKEMKEKGYRVDDLSYFVMFQCFCRNGDVNEADLILRKLVKRKFDIDINVYGNFIYALCKSGKFREANKLFRKLIKGDAFRGTKEVGILKEGRRAIFQLNSEGNVPEIMAYEVYFRSLCSVGKLEDAEVLLKKMMKKRNVPEICIYGSFIKALFRVGRDEDAFKFYNVERKKGIIRVEEIARYMIRGLCERGKVDNALEILNDIVKSYRAFACMDICNYLLDSYWREGRVANAESFFEKLQNGVFGKPDISTYTIMVSGLCKQGNVSRALLIFEEMRSRSIPINGTLYEAIIRGLCACGRVEDAFKYLSDMIEDGVLVSGKRWKVILHSISTIAGGIDS